MHVPYGFHCHHQTLLPSVALVFFKHPQPVWMPCWNAQPEDHTVNVFIPSTTADFLEWQSVSWKKKKKTNLVNKHRKCPTTQCSHLDQLLRTLNEYAGWCFNYSTSSTLLNWHFSLEAVHTALSANSCQADKKTQHCSVSAEKNPEVARSFLAKPPCKTPRLSQTGGK